MIAHRLSTVKNCDRILCLDAGRVLEQGSHDELLQIDVEKDANGKTVAGLYNDLWTTQMGAKDEKTAQTEAELAKAKKRIAELEEMTNTLHKKLEDTECC